MLGVTAQTQTETLDHSMSTASSSRGQFTVHRAEDRGHADHGWLDTHHSFSFAGWHAPDRMHFGAMRVLNDDVVAGGGGFGCLQAYGETCQARRSSGLGQWPALHQT